MKFEVNFNNAFLIANAGITILHEEPAGGLFPAPGQFPTNRIISSKQPVHVHMTWSASGPLHLIMNRTAEWSAAVYLEQMGGAEAAPGQYVETTAVTGGLSNNYHVRVNIPAGLAPGVYRMVYSVTLKHESGTPLPVAGFTDGGFLQVFEGI